MKRFLSSEIFKIISHVAGKDKIQAYVIGGFENESYGDIDTDDLKIGFNVVTYAGGKIIIEKLSEESVRPRLDLPVS